MGDFVPGTRWVLAHPAAKLSHARPATRNIPRAMPALVPYLSKISTVIALFAMTAFDAVAQDAPNADARADMERRVEEQNNGGRDPPPGLTPNMGIVPGENVPLTAPPQDQAPPQTRGPAQMIRVGPRSKTAADPRAAKRSTAIRANRVMTSHAVMMWNVIASGTTIVLLP